VSFSVSYPTISIDQNGNTHIVSGNLVVDAGTLQKNGQAWQNATLQNGTTALGSGFSPAGYMLDAEGFVHLRGGLSFAYNANNASTVRFTLPTGYRPPYMMRFAALGWNYSPAMVEVHTDGTVYCWSSQNPTSGSSYVVLDGIVFPTF
jgi:hypothetical protein